MMANETEAPEKPPAPPPASDGSDTAAGRAREGGAIKKLEGSLSGKRKRWLGIWKRWKEGEESDWWIASTGIP